jgi:hypothetical protein
MQIAMGSAAFWCVQLRFPGGRTFLIEALEAGKEGAYDLHAVDLLILLQVFGQQVPATLVLSRGHDQCVPVIQAETVFDRPGGFHRSVVHPLWTPILITANFGSHVIGRDGTELFARVDIELVENLHADAAAAFGLAGAHPLSGAVALGLMTIIETVEQDIGVQHHRSGHRRPRV